MKTMKEIVYHGSQNGDIKELTARMSTHQKLCIYATSYQVVALINSAPKGHRDLDIIVSSVDGMIELVERRPGVFKNLFDNKGYIYELDGETFSHYDYLWSKEVISFEKAIKPLNKITIDNILVELEKEEKQGNIKIFRYPNRPENIPLDNSDLIEKYIKYEESGLTGAISELIAVYPEFKERVSKILEEKKSAK